MIATGGGVVLLRENRELLRTRTVCVFLDAGHDLLWKRLRRDRRRPLLQVADPAARLRELSAERDPLYRETAHIVVDRRMACRSVGWSTKSCAGSLARIGDEQEPRRRRPRSARRAQLLDRRRLEPAGRDGELSRSCRAAAARSSSATRRSLPCTANASPLRSPRSIRRSTSSRCRTAKRTRPGRRCRRSSTRCWRRIAIAARRCSPSAAAWSAISPDSPPPATCAASPTSRCRRRCSPRSIPRSAARPAINHPSGKNMIGAFHQPLAVVADVDVLESLPDRELVAGLAEVIKYGAVADDAFLGWIEDSLPALLARDKPSLVQAVTRSCHIKARDRRQRRARVGAARDPQLRPHVRAMRSRPAPATAPGSMARRSAAAWRWRPTCRRASA